MKIRKDFEYAIKRNKGGGEVLQVSCNPWLLGLLFTLDQW